jgi:hypothetical protein
MALAAILIGGAYVYADRAVERYLRPAIVQLLEERMDGRVTLDALRVRVFPRLSVRGEGLTVRHAGRTDIPPLLTARTFTVDATARELWTRRVERVHLDGLEITIPPGRGREMPRPAPGLVGSIDGERVVIGEVVTERSLLTIMSRQAGKSPRVFELKRIRFENFTFDDPAPFEATLVNPAPAGDIAVVGSFGPWDGEVPGATPLSGSFTFDADLASIRGIGGALDAEGSFGGPLEYIRTHGKARSDDFSLSSGGGSFPLIVDYDAIVDGTNGDTILERVDGTLGQSAISARGAIIKVDGVVRGRQLSLEASARNGRLEDFLRLTTKVEQSPMTGLVNTTATLVIPPGPGEVMERMDLAGRFDVNEVRFTTDTIQDRIDELSRRGQGRPRDESIDDVASGLRGQFRLKDRRMSVQGMQFSVQGAQVHLDGSYNVATEALAFEGSLRLQARASRTQTGWRSIVLKVFDPFLDGDGAGTVIPISVTGSKDAPQFRADLKQALFR